VRVVTVRGLVGVKKRLGCGASRGVSTKGGCVVAGVMVVLFLFGCVFVVGVGLCFFLFFFLSVLRRSILRGVGGCLASVESFKVVMGEGVRWKVVL